MFSSPINHLTTTQTELVSMNPTLRLGSIELTVYKLVKTTVASLTVKKKNRSRGFGGFLHCCIGIFMFISFTT